MSNKKTVTIFVNNKDIAKAEPNRIVSYIDAIKYRIEQDYIVTVIIPYSGISIFEFVKKLRENGFNNLLSLMKEDKIDIQNVFEAHDSSLIIE